MKQQVDVSLSGSLPHSLEKSIKKSADIWKMKPSEQDAQKLHILTAARGHLAGSQERGPRKIPARGLAEGDAPALGRQPLTHLLSPLGSDTTADRAL